MSDSVRTTCPYCGVGCGLVVSRQNGDLSIAPDRDHPANFGRICSKGAALGETLHQDDRLTTPAIENRSVSWDVALDRIAGEFKRAIRVHGPDSVAFYVSGQLLTEDYYVANKLMKGFIGSANIDTNSRLCMASSVAGHKRAFGSDTVPGSYADLESADLVVLTGSNLAWCHPVLFQRLIAAKQQRPSLQIVVIDPRRTATCELADVHLPIKPDGDVELFLGLLAHLADSNAVDETFVAEHTNGYHDALSAARRLSRRALGEATGLNESAIQLFYRAFERTERVVTVYSQGVNQSVCGTDKVNAIINCHLVTGRIGRLGMGPFSVTGQPNAMGGREVGGLANQLACHMDIDNPVHNDLVRRYWRAPRMAKRNGLKAVELFKACREGRIKALWVMATNPAVSLPSSSLVQDALRRCPFVVVSDVTATTDTARAATVLLPAAGWGEKDGTVTNSERRISRQRRFLPAVGQARPDWWAITQVARRLGFNDAFPYESADEIFREHAALSGFENAGSRDFDISALSEVSANDYDAMDPVQWPAPATDVKGSRSVTSLFDDGRFFTADGRARFVPVVAQADRTAPSARTWRFNSGRIRDQWHTMTRTGLVPRLNDHFAEPYVEIHPADALEIGLEPASLAMVQGEDNTLVCRALLTDRQPRGAVFVPMHWSDVNSSAGRVNRVVASRVDRISGQPALKSGEVTVERYPAAWYGFIVSTALPVLGAMTYWASAVTPNGWRVELADTAEPGDWTAFVQDLLSVNETAGDALVEMRDDKQGKRRFVISRHGEIAAMAFFAREPVEISRAWAVTKLLARASEATSVLAGRAPVGTRDIGAIVCSCFGVGKSQIIDAIVEHRCNDLEAIGGQLSAGTNCGSCRAEIQRMINDAVLSSTA